MKYSIAIILTVIILYSAYLILPKIEKPVISVVIVPHHDLVKNKRSEFFNEIKNRIDPNTIIVVSPNHFLAGNGNIITTDKTWSILDAQIKPNKKIISDITDKKLAKNDELPFSREHGIYNLLAPIHDSFPEASIVPLIIKPKAPKEDLDNVIIEMVKLCRNNCLLIASVDFSHYLPGALAEIHDNLSIRALNNLDENLVWQAEVDSQESLYLAQNWAKYYSSNKFNLFNNNNSGKLDNSRDAESTSYVFGWFEKDEKNTINNETTFVVYKGIDEKNNSIGERFFRGTDIIKNNGDLNSVFSGIDPSQDLKGKIDYLDNLVNNNNLAVAGLITNDKIKFVLLPFQKENGKSQLLRGEEKTTYISKIINDINIENSNIAYGYDIIEIKK